MSLQHLLFQRVHASKYRAGLADVISMHETLNNWIPLFHLETVATPWVQYVRPILVRHASNQLVSISEN